MFRLLIQRSRKSIAPDTGFARRSWHAVLVKLSLECRRHAQIQHHAAAALSFTLVNETREDLVQHSTLAIFFSGYEDYGSSIDKKSVSKRKTLPP